MPNLNIRIDTAHYEELKQKKRKLEVVARRDLTWVEIIERGLK